MARINKFTLPILVGMLLLTSPIAFAAIWDWEPTVVVGGWESYPTSFSILDTNQNCTLDETELGEIEEFIVNIPEYINFTTDKIKPYIFVPEDTIPSIYSGSIEYIDEDNSLCGSSFNIKLTVAGGEEEKKCLDWFSISYYPSKPKAGERLTFWIQNTSESTTVNGFVTIKSRNPDIDDYEVICNAGSFCEDYVIPLNERGPLLCYVTITACTDETKILQPIELYGATGYTNDTWGNGATKEISITGYSEVNLGDDFQFLVIGENAPLKYAEVSIVGPSAYSFLGSTSSSGLVVDSAGKIYGTEVKPSKLGDYTMFVERDGFKPAQFGFSVSLEDCPHECCTDGTYETKECKSGFDCTGNECVEPQKPKMSISCPIESPKTFDTIICTIYKPDSTVLAENIPGTLTIAGETTAIIFKSGIAEIPFGKETGVFTIEVPDVFDHIGATYVDEVVRKTPEIDWWVIGKWFGGVVVVVIIILAIRWALSKRGGKAVFEIPAGAQSMVEKNIREK